jgi:hypothetical protein
VTLKVIWTGANPIDGSAPLGAAWPRGRLRYKLSSDGFAVAKARVQTCPRPERPRRSRCQAPQPEMHRAAGLQRPSPPSKSLQHEPSLPYEVAHNTHKTQTYMRTHKGDDDARGRTLEWVAHSRARTRTQCVDDSREFGVLAARGAHMTCVYLLPRLLQARWYSHRLCLFVRARGCATHSSVRPRASSSPLCVRMYMYVCV